MDRPAFTREFSVRRMDNLKKIITAVILVALIVAAFSMLSTPRVRADTSEAQVLSYSWYVAPARQPVAKSIGLC
jgi:hypothetical protein